MIDQREQAFMQPKVQTHSMSASRSMKKDHEIAKGIAVRLVHHAIQTGILGSGGDTDAALKDEIVKFLRNVMYSRGGISMILDYRTTLLKEARRYRAVDQDELAVVFYATWMQHWVNNVLSSTAKRKGLSEVDIIELIRDTNIDSKFTWLPRILGLPSIAGRHVTRVSQLARLRNAFVHYKWKANDTDVGRNREREVANLLRQIDKVVAYLRRYENKYVLKGLKNRVRKFL